MGCNQSIQTFISEIQGDEEEVTSSTNANPMKSRHDYVPDRGKRRSQVTANLKKYQDNEQSLSREHLGSFLDIQKRRLINEVIRAHAGPNGEGFILVLDKLSTFLVSTQLSMNEIMYPKESVCLIENIMKRRQPSPSMEAVYFTQPTADSIKKIVADFKSETGPAQYGGVHIVLTGKCPQEGIELIKSTKRLVKHLVTFREIQIDVFPTEPHLINFGLPDTMNQLFGHGLQLESDVVSKQYHLIASRLVSVCSSLHELPHVRVNARNKRSINFYAIFAKKMEEYMRSNPDWKWHDETTANNGINQRATLIVLDRRDDLATVLRHEFTYQALIHDTYEKDIKCGIGQTSFEYSSILSSGKEIKMSLSDTLDPIWMHLRHESMVDIAITFENWKKAFRSSEAYKLYAAGQNGNHPKHARKIMELMRTKDETSKALKTFSQHGELITLLRGDMLKRNGKEKLLLDIGELEAQIMTGYSVNDSSIKEVTMSKIQKKLFDLLNAPEVNSSDKLRLILLWFITFGGDTSRKNAQKIFDACEPKLPATMERIIPCLSHLHVAINESSETNDNKIYKLNERSRIHKRAYELEKENTKLVRRMESKLKDIIKRHLKGTLHSVNEYSWHDPVGVNVPIDFQDENVGNAPAWYFRKNNLNSAESKHLTAHSRNPSSQRAGTSLRSHKISKGLGKKNNNPSFGNMFSGNTGGQSVTKTGSLEEVETKETVAKEINGSRIIVLMIGGATFAETKDCYDIMKKTGREIIMCTTGMLTPIMFTESLRNMARKDDDDDDDDDDEQKRE